MNNMGMMNNKEAWWNLLSSDQKKFYLNSLLFNNHINIPIYPTEWNCDHLNNFIKNATYDDVMKLPKLIKALLGKPLSCGNYNNPEEYLYMNNGMIYFYDCGKIRSMMPFLGTLRNYATESASSPISFQSDNNIPNKKQYNHLIKTLKKVY